MELMGDIAYLIGLIFGIYIIFRIFKEILLKLQQRKFVRKLKKLFLSKGVKAKADRKFSKLLHKFKRKHRRNPTRDELFRIVINASHITIRRKGGKGHWGRQKVRKYLLESHQVVKKYVMR